MTRPVHLADSGDADYLYAQCWEMIYQIFYERGNAPLEFSALRISLQSRGVKAKDHGHWGILAAALKSRRRRRDGTTEEPILDAVGRELAVARSRNAARNQTYRLSRQQWFVAENLAAKRGWKSPLPHQPEPQPVQETLL